MPDAVPSRGPTALHRRSSTIAVTPLLAFLMLVLAGCSTIAENCKDICPTAAQTILAQPHVNRVSAFDAILRGAPGGSPPSLDGVAPYFLQAQGASLAVDDHVRALITVQGELMAFDLTSSTVQPITTVTTGSIASLLCHEPAISPDNRFLACRSTGDEGCSPPCVGDLTLASVSADWPPTVTVLQQIQSGPRLRRYYRSPSWSPDGRYLAVITADSPVSDAHREITLFARGPGSTPLVVSGYLTLPNDPIMNQVAWSPDGHYLAVLNREDDLDPMVLVPTSELAPALAEAANPVTVSPTVQKFTTVGYAALTWAPDSKSLTVLDSRGLMRLAVPSGVESPPLVSLPAHGLSIGPFAWLGDGHSLLFPYGAQEDVFASRTPVNALALVRPGTCACMQPSVVAYVYTAP